MGVPHARVPLPPAVARQAGRWRASERTGQEWFCHSIHIITGVTLFYVGGGFITGVFACYRCLYPSTSALGLLISSKASLLPYREHIFRAPSSVISLGFQPHIQLLFGPHLGSYVHWNWESRASGTSAVFVFTYSGEGRQSRFWGVSLAARLLTSSSTSWRVAGDRHSFSSTLHRA